MLFFPFGVASGEVIDPEKLTKEYQEASRIAGKTGQLQWIANAFSGFDKIKRGDVSRIMVVKQEALTRAKGASIGGGPTDPDLRHDDSTMFHIPYNRGFVEVDNTAVTWTATYPELVLIAFSHQYIRELPGGLSFPDGYTEVDSGSFAQTATSTAFSDRFAEAGTGDASGTPNRTFTATGGDTFGTDVDDGDYIKIGSQVYVIDSVNTTIELTTTTNIAASGGPQNYLLYPQTTDFTSAGVEIGDILEITSGADAGLHNISALGTGVTARWDLTLSSALTASATGVDWKVWSATAATTGWNPVERITDTKYGDGTKAEDPYQVRARVKLLVDGGLIEGTGPFSLPMDGLMRGTGFEGRMYRATCVAMINLSAGPHRASAAASQMPHTWPAGYTAYTPDDVDYPDEHEEYDADYIKDPSTQGVCIGSRRMIVIRFPKGTGLGS